MFLKRKQENESCSDYFTEKYPIVVEGGNGLGNGRRGSDKQKKLVIVTTWV